MSREGNCWDNACSETLFGSLKAERLHGMEFHIYRRRRTPRSMLLWYNGSRMHSTLGYLSTTQFEQQALALAARQRRLHRNPTKSPQPVPMSDAF